MIKPLEALEDLINLLENKDDYVTKRTDAIRNALQVLEAIKKHAVIQDNKLTIDFDGIMNISWNQEKGMVKDYDLQAIDDYSLIQNFMRGE